MRIILKIILFFIDRNLIYEESRVWQEKYIYHNGYGGEKIGGGYWDWEIFIYKAGTDPIKDGIVARCSKNMRSRWSYFWELQSWIKKLE